MRRLQLAIDECQASFVSSFRVHALLAAGTTGERNSVHPEAGRFAGLLPGIITRLLAAKPIGLIPFPLAGCTPFSSQQMCINTPRARDSVDPVRSIYTFTKLGSLSDPLFAQWLIMTNSHTLISTLLESFTDSANCFLFFALARHLLGAGNGQKMEINCQNPGSKTSILDVVNCTEAEQRCLGDEQSRS